MHANSPRSHQQQASACFLIFTNMLSKWSLDSLICNSESQLNIFSSFLDIRTSSFENSMLTGLSPFLGWVLIFLVWYKSLPFVSCLDYYFLPPSSMINHSKWHHQKPGAHDTSPHVILHAVHSRNPACPTA